MMPRALILLCSHFCKAFSVVHKLAKRKACGYQRTISITVLILISIWMSLLLGFQNSLNYSQQLLTTLVRTNNFLTVLVRPFFQRYLYAATIRSYNHTNRSSPCWPSSTFSIADVLHHLFLLKYSKQVQGSQDRACKSSQNWRNKMSQTHN